MTRPPSTQPASFRY
uniref:Putative pre-mRNA-splicing factor ATP-dependent RNA helicase DEAH9 n=1 Tax=Rhizophora mucronata TaxID=61149 RepID=A0A2P2M6C8_RHIMU